MRVNRIVQLLILGMLSLPLHGDDCLGTYRRLTAECYAYIKFFETNCANELQQLLADTNAVSPRIVQRQDVSGVGKSIGGAVATNAVFAVRRHRGGWHFSYITASYADGTQLQINLSKRGITQLHWTMGSRRGQSFEIQAGEEGQEKILCYDVERVGEGDDEDLYLSNIRHYEGSRLVREDPPNRLGEMIFENKASRLHQPSSSAANLPCAADLKPYFKLPTLNLPTNGMRLTWVEVRNTKSPEVDYMLSDAKTRRTLLLLKTMVLHDEKDAQDKMISRVANLTRTDKRENAEVPIGDRRFVFGSSPGCGAIIFTRYNVLVELSSYNKNFDFQSIAIDIDSEIKSRRNGIDMSGDIKSSVLPRE